MHFLQLWVVSFRVHVKLFYRIVSYRIAHFTLRLVW